MSNPGTHFFCLTACPAPTASKRAFRLRFLILRPLFWSDLDHVDAEAEAEGVVASAERDLTLLEEGEEEEEVARRWWRLEDDLQYLDVTKKKAVSHIGFR